MKTTIATQTHTITSKTPNFEMDQGWSEKYIQEKISQLDDEKADMLLKEATTHWKQLLKHVHPKFLYLLQTDWIQSWIEHNT